LIEKRLIKFYKAETEIKRLLEFKMTNFVEFTNCFYNCVYILKTIWENSPKIVKEKLETKFFPSAIKMLRESKQHKEDDFYINCNIKSIIISFFKSLS